MTRISLVYAHDRALSTRVLIEFCAAATHKLRRPVEEAEAALEDSSFLVGRLDYQ